MDSILKRRLASLEYSDPETLLQKVLPTVAVIFENPELVKGVSAKERKASLEEYQAAYLKADRGQVSIFNK